MGAEAREIDGEIVIYDLRNRRYLGGNRTATALRPLLAEGADRGALSERLQSTFGVDADRARTDVDAFVESLSSLGLLAPPGD